MEDSPDSFAAEMLSVFREVRRVLRDDGTLWLNLGDSYAGSWGARGRSDATNAPRPDLEAKHGTNCPARYGYPNAGIKPKDLIGIPWRVALTLQADGWWLRQDNVWAKPNPMPESVTDRTTRSHEYVFMLTKSARYYYDAKAIEEPGEMRPQNRYTNGRGQKSSGYAPHRQPTGMTECDTRNKRSVWNVNTQAYSGAHFAVMPDEIATICILAGSKPGDTVLDPFGGAGTTGAVAYRLGRNPILIDLNPAYCRIAERRIAGETPPLPLWG